MLEAFVYDPLISWNILLGRKKDSGESAGGDATVAGATPVPSAVSTTADATTGAINATTETMSNVTISSATATAVSVQNPFAPLLAATAPCAPAQSVSSSYSVSMLTAIEQGEAAPLTNMAVTMLSMPHPEAVGSSSRMSMGLTRRDSLSLADPEKGAFPPPTTTDTITHTPIPIPTPTYTHTPTPYSYSYSYSYLYLYPI